jgi:hypothetical protein
LDPLVTVIYSNHFVLGGDSDRGLSINVDTTIVIHLDIFIAANVRHSVTVEVTNNNIEVKAVGDGSEVV